MIKTIIALFISVLVILVLVLAACFTTTQVVFLWLAGVIVFLVFMGAALLKTIIAIAKWSVAGKKEKGEKK